MDIYSFSDKYLKPYKIKNDEIIPAVCPYCKGGEHGDRDTFALNITRKTYNCKRGKCSKTGAFSQLCKDFGEEADRENTRYEYNSIKQKIFKTPVVESTELSAAARQYAHVRKISNETLEHFKVKEKDGNFLFPFYDINGTLVFVKYRPIKKVEKGERKAFREPGGKPILWGLDMIDTNQPVVITEGEIDAMSVYETGYTNVVSVPAGSQDLDWIELCWDTLVKIKKFIMFGDNDIPGVEMIRKIVVRLGEDRCFIAEHEYKDANELLYRKGKDAVLEAIICARPIPKAGLIQVADISVKPQETIGIASGFLGLDRMLDDFHLGELTVWSGKNAEGKSTILGQVILEALDNNVGVFCFSGELTAERFSTWIDTQASGQENLIEYKNKYGDPRFRVKEEIAYKIKEWYRDKLFLYDNAYLEEENTSIMEMCKYAASRYNCQVFVIDNLMTAEFKVEGEFNYYYAQSKFIGLLKKFARSYNVHVHVVAHPKKTSNKAIEKEDISGSNEIMGKADNIISIRRATEEDLGMFDAELSLLKNRENGEMGEVPLKFVKSERRFYQLQKNNEYYRKYYGWNKSNRYDGYIEVNGATPWEEKSENEQMKMGE